MAYTPTCRNDRASRPGRRRIMLPAWALVIVALFLAACGSTPTSAPEPPAPTATTYVPDITKIMGITDVTAIATPTGEPAAGPADCPSPPAPTVTIDVNPTALKVGDSLTVIPHPEGFALAQQVYLMVDSAQAAVLDWQSGEIRAYDAGTVLQVLPAAGMTRTFTLRAIGPGTVEIAASAYGDAGFCSFVTTGPCICSTTHMTVYTSTVRVTVSP